MATPQRLERLAVTNFQSLGKADIELGAFTVIVGPSNSGKSALLRALKAVVRNVNSPSAVKVGHTAFTAQVAFADTVVSIERGKSQSTYRINLPNGDEEVYTKAGRTVPEDVQNVLRLPLPEGPDLTFSSQIDPPFLLSETGTVAAKMLGDLTNVSKLHAASRESNRLRLEATKIQKIRIEDAAACADRMKSEFSDLRSHSVNLKEARAAFEEVKAKARLAESLTNVLEDFDMTLAAEEDLLTRLEELPQPKDIEALAEEAGGLLGERHALLDAISTLSSLVASESMLLKELESAFESEKVCSFQYQEMLKSAGSCPTCGQEVH